MAARKDAYGEKLEIGDYVIKGAQTVPDYAIIVDFVDNVGAKGTQHEYRWETIRIESYRSKPGNTHGNRLMKIAQTQMDLEVAVNLSKKLEAYREKINGR